MSFQLVKEDYMLYMGGGRRKEQSDPSPDPEPEVETIIDTNEDLFERKAYYYAINIGTNFDILTTAGRTTNDSHGTTSVETNTTTTKLNYNPDSKIDTFKTFNIPIFNPINVLYYTDPDTGEMTLSKFNATEDEVWNAGPQYTCMLRFPQVYVGLDNSKIIVSAKPTTSYTPYLHPAFIDEDGNECRYIEISKFMYNRSTKSAPNVYKSGVYSTAHVAYLNGSQYTFPELPSNHKALQLYINDYLCDSVIKALIMVKYIPRKKYFRGSYTPNTYTRPTNDEDFYTKEYLKIHFLDGYFPTPNIICDYDNYISGNHCLVFSNNHKPATTNVSDLNNSVLTFPSDITGSLVAGRAQIARYTDSTSSDRTNKFIAKTWFPYLQHISSTSSNNTGDMLIQNYYQNPPDNMQPFYLMLGSFYYGGSDATLLPIFINDNSYTYGNSSSTTHNTYLYDRLYRLVR